MTLRYSPMKQDEALYMVARAYPGGLEKLAEAMNISFNVLRNKVRPDITTHKCSDEESSRIMELAQDAGVPDALMPLIAKNWRHRMIAFPMPDVMDLESDEATKEMTQSLCSSVKEFGDVATVASIALADRRVTAQEFADFEKQAQEAVAAILELKERMHAAAFPAHEGDRT